MRRTWLGVRGVPRGIAAWLALAAALGGWRCAVDNRSPKEVVAAETPTGDGSDGTSLSKVPNGGAAGSSALAQTGGAAGNGPTGSSEMGSAGSDNSPAGSGSAGSGPASGSAGSTSMTSPPGAGGEPPAGDLPVDPFGGLGDFGDQGGASNTGANTGANTGSSNSTCPSFDACGGALDGTWTYGNVCIDPTENSADLLQELCPTASVMYERGGTSTLTFTGSSVSRAGAPLGDSVITFPAVCVEGLGCSFLADASTDCTDMGGDCVCRTASSIDWGTQSYTTAGGQLSLGNGRSFDYCVQGDTLTYRETGDAQEAGTNTLQRN